MKAISKTTILLINFHSADNAGDAALLEATIRQLREAFGKPRLILSANHPHEPSLTSLGVEVVSSPSTVVHTHKSVWMQPIIFVGILITSALVYLFPRMLRYNRILPISWRQMFTAYHQASLVVSCPGNQFFSMGRFGWPLLISGLAVYLAHLFRKPIYIMPQSLGPLFRRWERNLMKWLYGKARLVFLRESISLQLAKEIGLPVNKLHLMPDLVFDSPNENQVESIAFLQRYGFDPTIPSLGVTVIKRMVKTLGKRTIDNYYTAMANALRYMANKYSIQIVFFPQVTGPSPQEDDRDAARQVVKQMDIIWPGLILIEEALPPGLLKNAYKHMDVFIASRLHSGIFALSMGVPTLFVGYLSKTRGVILDLEFEEWLVELAEVNDIKLCNKLESLWLQRRYVREKIQTTIPKVAYQASQVGYRISHDYYKTS